MFKIDGEEILFSYFHNYSKIKKRYKMNIYIISCESYHLMDKEIAKIVKDNHYLLFNMNNISLSDIIEEANYFSLTGETKYIVVKNADFLGGEKLEDNDQKKLITYINNPNINTVIIFTTLKPLAWKKIEKEINANNYQIINYNKLDKKSIINEITKYVKERNYEIDYQSINYLIDNSYSSLDIIFNELDKIMLFYLKPQKINFKDINNLVGIEINNNSFRFVNLVIEKNLSESLKSLNDLKINKVEPISLVALLAREYRLMYYVKKMQEKNLTKYEMCQELQLRDWQLNKIYNNAITYSKTELEKNLVDLCNIDLNIKKGIWDKDIALYGFLLEACI